MSEPPPSHPVSTAGPVHLIGSGLLGASIGLALTRAGVPVTLEDASPAAAALARDVGAGDLVTPGEEGRAEVRVVVVAVPPDVTADVVVAALQRFPDAVVTDVASVKTIVLREALGGGRGGHDQPGRPRAVRRVAPHGGA